MENKHMKWWNSLSQSQQIATEIRCGFFGHDMGTTDDDVRKMYELAGVEKTNPLLLSMIGENQEHCEKVFRFFYFKTCGLKVFHEPPILDNNGIRIFDGLGEVYIFNNGKVSTNANYNPWDFIDLIRSLGYEPERK